MDKQKTLPSIFFYTVDSPQKKLLTIYQIARDHFARKEKLLILTPGQQVADYIDTLLWKSPTESFLPHGQNASDLIEIVCSLDENKSCKNVLNLTSHLLDTPQIHELYDLTSPEKEALSKAHYNHYQECGCPISQIG